jgi:hypothetical protein
MMDEDKQYSADGEKANELGIQLLHYVAQKTKDPNIAQAAMGSAWVKLCEAMQFDRIQFKDMCQGILELYQPYCEELE